MRLKLMEFNVQDLFLDLAYPVRNEDLEVLTEGEWQLLGVPDVALKPLAKLKGLAQVFKNEAPDVAMLCEIGGAKALKAFAHLFLDDAYEPYLVEGNDSRGIDSGFLVRRGLALKAEIHGHKDWPVPFLYLHEQDPVAHEVTALWASSLGLEAPDERKLSRDIPELRLARADGSLALVLLLAHLKSGLDSDRIDPGGKVRRAAEFQALLALRDETQRTAGSQVPVIVAGDLNGTAARSGTAAEFQGLYSRTDLEDVLEVAGRAKWERITHLTYFQDQGRASQLDYILVPAALRDRVDKDATYVYRYKEEGGEVQMPGNMRDRWQLPSDHYPVVTVVDIADGA